MKHLEWREILGKFVECLHDDRGSALTEYSIMTVALMPAAFFLFHPDNGLYKAARDQYDLTTLLLICPGP